MKKYKILYEFYPFNMDNLHPKSEIVEAENLKTAIKIIKNKYGDKIEIFEYAAKKFYNE